MADLVIEAGDVTASGSNTTSATLSVDYPAYVSGDLIVLNISMWTDGGTHTVTWPAGPNSETVTSVTNTSGPEYGDKQQLAVGYFVGTERCAALQA